MLTSVIYKFNAMSINISDFSKICRICLNNTNYLQLISVSVIEMIQACTNVRISFEDDLPNHICQTCSTRLQDSFDFKELCEKSDCNLRKIIKEYKINNGNENSFRYDNDDDISVKDEAADSDESDCKFTESECKVERNGSNIVSNIKSESEGGIENTNENKSDFLENSIADFSRNSEVKSKLKNRKRNRNRAGKKSSDLKVRKKEKPYTCEECKEKFEKTWSLAFHMKRVHEAKGVKCDKCPKILYHTLHLLEHQKMHNNTDFVCDICQKHFLNQHILTRHKSKHTTVRTFYCLKCNNSFKDQWVLKKHIQTVHLHAPKRVACEICNKKMLPRHLERHRLIHQQKRETISCEKCSKTFYHASSLKMHILHEHENVDRKYKHLCNVCGRSMLSEAEVKRHLLTHTGEKPYACDKCDKKYRTTSMLKTHISRAHLNVRNHICNICSKAFFDRNMLANHVRVHTGERPFSCDACKKNYKTQSMLTTHISRKHLNKKEHVCTVCSKRFHDRRNLNNHIQTHSEQKPFVCKICEKKYSSKSALNTHLKIHVVKNENIQIF